MTLYTTTLQTPFGTFSAAVNETGAVVATAFGGLTTLRTRINAAEAPFVRDDRRTAEVRRQVGEYCSGRRRDFSVKLAATGTPFQQRVWQALAEIPFASTWNYAQLAGRVGSGARAVGGANAANPICLIVPCHRVIGSDGSLTGFAFGERLKRRLLVHEQRWA